MPWTAKGTLGRSQKRKKKEKANSSSVYYGMLETIQKLCLCKCINRMNNLHICVYNYILIFFIILFIFTIFIALFICRIDNNFVLFKNKLTYDDMRKVMEETLIDNIRLRTDLITLGNICNDKEFLI